MVKSYFAWQGVNRLGQSVHGNSTANSKQAVHLELLAQRIRPTHIQKQWRLDRSQIKPSQITPFIQQLSTLISANVPLLQSLEIIEKSHPQSTIQALANQLKAHIESGASFYQAALNCGHFDSLFCHVIAASELSGQLDVLLARVSKHREQADQLRANLRSALVYPCLVLFIAVAICMGLLVFVVPTFQSVFASFDAELPVFTQWVIWLSEVLTHSHWVYVLASASALSLGLKLGQKSQRVKSMTQQLLLKLPLFGRLMQQAYLARWSRTLSTLTRASVALTDAIEAVAPMIELIRFQHTQTQIQASLRQGQSLSQALQNHPDDFPAFVVQMCIIGEESGSLETMLEKVATHYENEIARTVEHLSVLLEPLIMTVLGLFIGGLMLALYLPVFQLGQVI